MTDKSKQDHVLIFDTTLRDGEQAPERSAVLQMLEQPQEQRRIESWISELPVSSSELLRRKFLRDYQRQLRQPR